MTGSWGKKGDVALPSDPERHRDALRLECWPNQVPYSQTIRYRLPGSLTFLQTSTLCGS